jgi:phosphoserine phosphatase RsbU/P
MNRPYVQRASRPSYTSRGVPCPFRCRRDQMMPPRVLVADDQPDVREALRLLLKPEGFTVATASSPPEVLRAVQASPFDAVLIDLNYTRDTTSGAEGLDLLTELHACDVSLPIVVMTAWASIGLAVEAMRRGAADFVAKPWDNAGLVACLRSCIDKRPSAATEPSPAQRDLQVARAVQQRLLPQQTPRVATLSCAARCQESGAVGGDFYDFLDLGPGRLGLVVADVSGKGVAAAIVMAHLSAALRTLTPPLSHDLAGLARQLSALLIDATGSQHYVTLFLAVYSENDRSLRYVNCGHLPPILRRASGGVEWLEPTAPVIGLIESFGAVRRETVLHPGDTLLVYTDGLTETVGPGGEELGSPRLLASLQEHALLDAPELVDELLDARRNFAAGSERDDITVLVAQGRQGHG